jgi:hypothetical protein
MLQGFTQQEDRMTTVSWKDVIESQITELDNYGTPEDMYTDPAESTPDEWTDLLYEIEHDIRNANGLSEPGLTALREIVKLCTQLGRGSIVNVDAIIHIVEKRI